MKKFVSFALKLIEKIKEDNVFGLSNELTYKIILSILPFTTFLMSLLGFVNIKVDKLLAEFASILPQQFLSIFNTFIQEVFYEKHTSILSISFLISIYSASSGFRAIMKGINKAHEQKDKRSIFTIHLISMGLVIAFAVAIISSIILLIYKDLAFDVLRDYKIITIDSGTLLSIFRYVTLLTILFFTIVFIYKISCSKKINFKTILPGVLFTEISWLIASKCYEIFVENFSSYSKIYGSIGSVFLFLIWINMSATLLMIGSEINSLLEKSHN